MWNCKHCNLEFNFDRNTDKANHSRHCDKNPSKNNSYKNLKKAQNSRIDEKLGKLSDYEVVCDNCNKTFTVNEREKRFPSKEKYFCSRSCANSIGGKAKSKNYYDDDSLSYRTIAWRNHIKECVVCGEDKVVAVHHVNENHYDNDPKNLVPLCPTHHHYMHSKHKILIQDKIDKYIKDKWG